MSSARAILAREILDRGPQRVDHEEQARMEQAQRRELAECIRAGDPDAIVSMILMHIEEWHGPGRRWPDAWPVWREALDDAQAARAERAG